MRVPPVVAIRLLVAWIVLIALLFVVASVRAADAQKDDPERSGSVVVITLDGAISPATADYAVRGIRKAAKWL